MNEECRVELVREVGAVKRFDNPGSGLLDEVQRLLQCFRVTSIELDVIARSSAYVQPDALTNDERDRLGLCLTVSGWLFSTGSGCGFASCS